jgi:hypothetical protein
MKKTTVAIGLLSGALVATNVWWAYQLLDSGVTLTYQEDSLRMNERALSQALAVIRVVAAPEAKREDVIAAVTAAAHDTSEPFEKEGYLWVGDLGLRFSDTGRTCPKFCV